MEILKQPSTLCMAGNMSHIVLSTEKDVSFVLAGDEGGDAIVKHVYSPDGGNRIEIDLKDILLPLLSFDLQDVSTPYRQTAIAKKFSATATEVGDGGETKNCSFTVIRAGVDHFDGDVETFLQQNFLTWQPNVKPVTYYTPEFLTYYAVVAATVKCTAFLENGTTQALALASIAAGECWTVPVQYAVIAGKCGGKLPQYYEVWAENASGQRLTYMQRYVASDMKSEEEEWILFENSLGGIDTFRAYGDSENTAKHTHNVAEIDENFEEYRVDTTREHKKNTGYLGRRERLWLLDFFPSIGKYVYTDSCIRRIVVTESDVSYNVKELPSAYSFTYKYADARPYLNLPRAELPQKVLNIKIPDFGSFTVAPRLAEFPRLTLSGGALFPVQNPYSEGWTVTTAVAILEYLINAMEKEYSGNGGVGHSHPNINLLNGLCFLEDYLRVNGNKIKAGFADTAKYLSDDSPIWRSFIRKDKDDTTSYNLGVGRSLTVGDDLNVDGDGNVDGSLTVGSGTKTKKLDVTNQTTTGSLMVNDTSVFGGTMSSPLFSPGFLDGCGWSIFKKVVESALGGGKDKYTLEIDNLVVRQTMTVMELLIQKVRSAGGMIVVSAANGKVKSVTEDGIYYKLTFEEGNTYVAHDLMRCQTFTGTTLKSYWVEVSETGTDWVKVLKSEFDTSVPAEGDETVLMGNTTDTKRQNMVLISATEDGQPRVGVMDGVSGKTFADALRARLGNLDGINDDAFPADRQPQGNGLYSDNAYLKGTFLLSTGEDVKTKFEIEAGKVESELTGIRDDFTGDKGFLNNGAFADGMDKWSTQNAAVFFLVGNKWIWANDNVLTKKGDGACVVKDQGRTVVRIRNKYIGQKNGNLKAVPTFAENSDGTKAPAAVYLSFFYRCKTAGTLKVEFENVDKTGFENFNSMSVEETLEATDGYKQYTCSGLWNGTGDFKLSFTGEIYLYMLILTTDKVESLTYKYRTLFEQSDKLVNIAAQNFDKDGNVLAESQIITTSKYNELISQRFNDDGTLKVTSGLVTTNDFDTWKDSSDGLKGLLDKKLDVETFTGMFAVAVDADTKIVTSAEVSAFVTKDADGKLESGVYIGADNIKLEGLVTANKGFQIDTDGSMKATSGTIGGFTIGEKNLTATSGALNIMPNGIEFRDSAGNLAYLGSENNIIGAFFAKATYGFTFACGAQFGAEGATKLNAAIDIAKGSVSGYKPVVSTLSADTTIVCDNDVTQDTTGVKHVRSGGVFLIMGNSTFGCTLPQTPENGTQYTFVISHNGFTLNAQGSNKICIDTDYSYSKTSYTLESHGILTLIYYDGYWYGSM